MKRISTYLLIIFSLCALFLAACARQEQPAQDDGEKGVLSGQSLCGENIRRIGRTEYEDGALNIYYTAAGFAVRFSGTRLEVTFKADNTSSKNNRPYFIVSTDTQVAPEGKTFALTAPEQTVTVANLSAGTHTVTVLKRSEPENGITSVTKIKTDGEFLSAPEHTGLKFQILGGSGISGHGCLGKPDEDWTTENSSSLHGFGYLAARMFGAECQFVSNSGMGLVWGYRGVSPLTEAYEAAGLIPEYNADGSTKCVKAKGEWAHTNFVPDVVIVNIGGNDFTSHIDGLSGAARTQAEEQFKGAVVSLLNRIHGLYPSAKVVWTCTSTRSGNGALANGAISALEYRSQINLVTISAEKDGADSHAGINTQIANAQKVADAISTKFSLTSVRENVTA